MTVQLAPSPRFQGTGYGGLPLVGGKLYTYIAGTTTPQATFTDSTQTTQNTNPVILDVLGEANVWLVQGQTYKFVLQDLFGNQLWTVDQIYGGQPLTQAAIGALLYPTTPAENTATVTPTNFIYPELNPLRYGADPTGVVDSSPALNNTFLVAGQYNSAMVRFPQNGQYLCNEYLTWNTNRVGVDFQGSKLDFSNLGAGTHGFLFTDSNGDVNTRALLNTIHPIINGFFLGPNIPSPVATCMFFNSGTLNQSNINVKNCAFENWNADVVFGVGGFCCSFDTCTFTSYSNVIGTYSVIQQSVSNTGERQIFTNCMWFNRPLIAQNQGSATEMYFTDCSFDYFNQAFNIVNTGQIIVKGGHIETNSDVNYWGYVAGSTGILELSGLQITYTGASKTQCDMFFSDSTVTNGGVFLRDVVIGGSGTVSTRVIGGNGNCRADNVIQYSSGARPTIGAGANRLAYGDFESASFVNEITLAGTTVPAQSTTAAYNPPTYSSATAYVIGNKVNSGSGNNYQCIAPTTGNAPPNTAYWSFIGVTGTHSLNFIGTANTPRATWNIPCNPGQYIQGEMYWQAPAITGTSANFNFITQYVDKAGTGLGTATSFNTTTNQTTFTKYVIQTTSPAPIGTANAQLIVNMFGGASGSPIGYIDALILNVF